MAGANASQASAKRAPSSNWVRIENERAGTSSWQIPATAKHGISGFADKVTVQRGRRRPALRRHHGRFLPGPRVPDGLLPGSRWPQDLAVLVDPGRQPAGPHHHIGHEHGGDVLAAVDHDAHPQGLARGHLSAEAGLERGRPGVHPIDRSQRREPRCARDPTPGHHVAGLQHVGRPQPVRGARRIIRHALAGRLVRPSLRRPRGRRSC